MSDTTAKWNLPFLEGTDPGALIDDIDAAKAALLDDLLTPADAGGRGSRPTSSPGILGRTYRSTGDGGVDLDTGTAWVTLRPGLFAALPGTPDEEQVILFQTAGMAAAGVGPWLCRYNSSLPGTSRWKVLAADPWVVSVATQQGINNAGFGDLATVGPSISTPEKGDWLVEFSAEVTCPAGGQASQSFSVGATAAQDADRAHVQVPGGTTIMMPAGRRSITKTGVASGSAITAKYSSFSSGTAYFSKRMLAIVPLRLG